jgi:hypothetical protein
MDTVEEPLKPFAVRLSAQNSTEYGQQTSSIALLMVCVANSMVPLYQTPGKQTTTAGIMVLNAESGTCCI